MKTFIYSILIILFSSTCYTQTIDGIDITNLSDTSGWEYYDTEEGGGCCKYKKLDGYFDVAGLDLDTSLSFYKWNPSGTDFCNIYYHFVSIFGKEDKDYDNILERFRKHLLDEDCNELSKHIQNADASIWRQWNILENDNGELVCALIWNGHFIHALFTYIKQ